MRIVSRLVKVLAILTAVAVFAVAAELMLRAQVLPSPPLGAEELSERPVMVSPVDPEFVATITRFRSCIGGDDSGTTADGQQEFQRNLAHILGLLPELRAQDSRVPVYAPFDATVSDVPTRSLIPLVSNPGPDGVVLVAADTPEWRMTISRLELANDLRVGEQLPAGTVVGWVARGEAAVEVKLHRAQPTVTERIRAIATGTPAMQALRDRGHVVLFDHMAPEERQRWTEEGFDLSLAEIARQQRVNDPCPDGIFFDAHTFVDGGGYDRCLSWRQFHQGTVTRPGFDVYGQRSEGSERATGSNHPCGAPPLPTPPDDEPPELRIPEPDA